MAIKPSSKAVKSKGRKYSNTQIDRSRRQRGKTIRRIAFTLAALLIVIGTMAFLILRSDNGISVFENAVGTVFKPIEKAFTSAASWVKDFTTNWRSYSKLEGEFDALSLENEQLSLQLSGMEEIELENDRLSKLLDARESYTSLDPVFSRVIARDPGQWFDTFTIDHGTSDGVTEGMPVVTGDGLVGYVFEAGLSYSKVMTIIDSRSAVSCLVQRTRDNGVMRGGASEDLSNVKNYIYYLPNVNNIVPGDVIVTSGTDSLYPKGLVMGEVLAVSQDTSSEGSYVIMTPYVDFKHIEEVLVLRVVVTSDELLPVVATPTPAPYVTIKPTGTSNANATIAPETSSGYFQYPTITPEFSPSPTPNANQSATPAPTFVDILPEDVWAQ